MRRLLPFFFFAVAMLFAVSAFGDAATEKAAQALQKKAIEEDNLNVNYPAAIKKLQAAINKCGSDKCGPKVRATLVRDLGAMQVLSGDVASGQASFDQAAQIDSSMQLDPAYANPTLNGMWAASVKKAGGATPPSGSSGGGGSSGGAGGGSSGGGSSGGGGSQPTGDFVHSPPPEALVRTPLPVYVEYGGSEKLTRVTVKYKGFGMTDWKPLDLPKVGSGFGALIPCKDVTQGDMKYYVQGFAGDDEVAVSGNRNKPFVVPVKQQIAGDPPALPGQSPPKQCAESAGEECPPDFPGCHNPKKEDGEECASGDECKSGACTDGKCVSKKAAGEECENDSDCQSGSCADGKCAEGTTEQKKKGPGEDCEENAECESNVCKDAKCEGGGKSKFPHIWIGVAGSIDAFIMQSANDACHLNAQGTAPLSGNYYCTDPNSGSNVPGAVASPPDWNNAIILGKSDQVSGGLALGNIRIMLSFDYAITQNILVGLRGGYVALTYPGGSPGAPFGPFHIEVRATYLVGKDALTKPFAPMIYVAGGVGEFDAKVGVTTILNPNCTQGDMLCSGTVNNKNGIPSGATQENAWLTAGPGFFKVGGGIHAFFAKKFAYTAGLGFVGALGGTAGFLPGIELEPIGFQVGF